MFWLLFRLMYFSNDNPVKKSILRVSMGGSDRLMLFRSKSPGDLAIDKQGRKLYWTDTELKKIEYGDLAGKSWAFIRFKRGKNARVGMGTTVVLVVTKALEAFYTPLTVTLSTVHSFLVACSVYQSKDWSNQFLWNVWVLLCFNHELIISENM